MGEMTCREVGLLFGITVGCGVVGGSFTAIIQQLKAVGLIIDSEAYEMPEPEATALNLTTTAHDSATHGHDASEEWFPEDGAERHLCTWAADMLICWGFALMLVGCYFTALGPVGGEKAAGDLKQTVWGGVCWGMAGFVIFGLATGLGLPPELPGMEAAELGDRQAWWMYTSVLTFISLGLLSYRKPFAESPASAAACLVFGLIFFILPHVTGSPHHAIANGNGERPPPELAALFTMSAMVAQALSWVFLGAITAVAYNRHYMQFHADELAVKFGTDLGGVHHGSELPAAGNGRAANGVAAPNGEHNPVNSP